MLKVRNVSLAYGAEPVLENLDLDIATGAFVSLVGPSGSGKTSVLRAVTGLQTPLNGSVELDVDKCDVGFLFQDDALLPWRTARQNVALGLRIRGIAGDKALAEADSWLARLGLAGLEQRYPSQLSGGQRKRVAIAQVLALKPKLLLMDEPFASLDAIVRARITQELVDWVEREHMTVLLVTHDLEEALSTSDVVYLLSQGPRARIRSRYEVPIPRPRTLIETRKHPAFGALLDRLWCDLADEVNVAGAEAAQ
ncbi:MAG TPA: ABC transporter ATP-binding protein [Alphaproteobacteria bacterium]|nr:ABC transporter ATP-binding protein [Alphaproteobacteria bacterium]